MKTIKLIGMCMLAAVLGMSVQSCSKDDYQSRIKELIINENNYKFDSDGGSYKRSIVVKISLVSRYLQMQIGVRPLLILQNQR